MSEYHKIQTVYKRDPRTNNKTLLMGEWSLPEFDYLQNNRWIFTEKVDGTNIRVMFDGTNITFGGKTDEAQIYAPLVKMLQEHFLPMANRFTELFPEGVILYGEGYGSRIQKGGGLYRPDVGFVLFDVRVGSWWLKHEDVWDVANKLSLDVVPVVGVGTLQDMIFMVQKGFNSNWGDFAAEGIVARPECDLQTRAGHRIITKIKYKDFVRTRQDTQ